MRHTMTLEEVQVVTKNMGDKEIASVIFHLRKRMRRYQKLNSEEAGALIAEMAKVLDLNALQTGRLQVLTLQADERLKAALKAFDKDSTAIHPLDRIEGDEPA